MAEKSTKIYYSMGEVAEMLDVSPSLVRFWEGKFDIITPHRNKKGNRMFSPDDVRNLKTIYHLVKERGMTLSGAAKHLKANRKAIERDMEITERLSSIRALLLEVRQELGGDGTVVDDTVDEVVGNIPVPPVQIVAWAREDEVLDELTNEVIEELMDEREEMLDFDPEPWIEPAVSDAPADPEPAKQAIIEQTLF